MRAAGSGTGREVSLRRRCARLRLPVGITRPFPGPERPASGPRCSIACSRSRSEASSSSLSAASAPAASRAYRPRADGPADNVRCSAGKGGRQVERDPRAARSDERNAGGKGHGRCPIARHQHRRGRAAPPDSTGRGCAVARSPLGPTSPKSDRSRGSSGSATISRDGPYALVPQEDGAAGRDAPGALGARIEIPPVRGPGHPLERSDVMRPRRAIRRGRRSVIGRPDRAVTASRSGR